MLTSQALTKEASIKTCVVSSLLAERQWGAQASRKYSPRTHIQAVQRAVVSRAYKVFDTTPPQMQCKGADVPQGFRVTAYPTTMLLGVWKIWPSQLMLGHWHFQASLPGSQKSAAAFLKHWKPGFGQAFKGHRIGIWRNTGTHYSSNTQIFAYFNVSFFSPPFCAPSTLFSFLLLFWNGTLWLIPWNLVISPDFVRSYPTVTASLDPDPLSY